MSNKFATWFHSEPAAAVIPGLLLPSSRTWFGISFHKRCWIRLQATTFSMTVFNGWLK